MSIKTGKEFFETVENLRFFQKQVYDYKWKNYEAKLNELEKQIDEYIYERDVSSNRKEVHDKGRS